jgi:dGTPase
MFEQVYLADDLSEERNKGSLIVEILYDYYLKHPEILSDNCLRWAEGDLQRAAVDYVSGLTDNYAISTFKKIFIPRG